MTKRRALLAALALGSLTFTLAFAALAHRPISLGGGGSVDLSTYVEGPESSTDNAICRFDGEGGKTLQGSSVLIDDDGDLTLSNADGPALMNEASTATNPTIVPNKKYEDNGIGCSAATRCDFITGGSQRITVLTTSILTQLPLYARSGVSRDNGALQIGTGAFVTGHSLTSTDAGTAGQFEVDGRLWADGGVTIGGESYTHKVVGTTVAEPYACDASHVGNVPVYVDDTDDSAAATYCVCIATGDDGAGAPNAFDWVRMDDTGTACPFF